jgi:uncharacterized protein
MRHLLTAALLLAGPAIAQSPDPIATDATLDGAARAIASGYADLAEAAGRLATETAALCDTPSEAALDSTRNAFSDIVAAWSRIELVRFGPILEDNAAERIFFFPDRRGIGERQVRATLAEEDPTALDPSSLAEKSVALQGLGTAEILLHGSGSRDLSSGAPYRCAFAEAVATRVTATAEKVADAWAADEGIATRFAAPAPGHPDFRSTDDSLRALLGVFTNGIELVRDARLAPLLRDGADLDDPRGAAWTLSGLTGPALAANFAGLETLFAASRLDGLGTSDALSDEIAFEFDNLSAALERFNAGGERRRDDIRLVGIVATGLCDTFGARVAPALGQTAAFSVTDGD